MNKKNLSETDICDKFITPALQAVGWDVIEQIYREYTLRPGRMVVRGKTASRDQRSVLRADYVQCFKANIPIAVIEAKDNNHAVGAGTGERPHISDGHDPPLSRSVADRFANLFA